MSQPSGDSQRLRPHPEDRFGSEQNPIDLNAVAARLRAEPNSGERGHRQETLYRQGGMTIAMFLFERFTQLPAHRAAGVVNMHVLRGRLKITVEDRVHELGAGEMLVLPPRVEHAVSAEEESEMLLTVGLVRQ